MVVEQLRELAGGSRLVRGARSALMFGRRVECPCCGSHFRRFRGFHGPNRLCWRCGALERHRSLWLFLDRRPDLTPPGMSVLHVAPEPVLRDRFAGVPGVRYVGGDLTAEYGPEHID